MLNTDTPNMTLMYLKLHFLTNHVVDIMIRVLAWEHARVDNHTILMQLLYLVRLDSKGSHKYSKNERLIDTLVYTQLH